MKFPSRLRTPVGAAALSALFPGLGQAAAGQPNRGKIVAIPALAVLGAFLLILIFERSSLFGLAVNQQWLTSLLILDLVAFIYHLWAIVDSYLVAGRAQPRKRPVSTSAGKWAATLGVGIIVSGTVLVHAGVAATDMDWQHALYCITAPTPCFVTDAPVSVATDDVQGDTSGPVRSREARARRAPDPPRRPARSRRSTSAPFRLSRRPPTRRTGLRTDS